jgi:septum formation protein
MNNLNKYEIILGSQSPRRKELLSSGGYDFKIIVTHVDESYDPIMDPMFVAEFISNKKAQKLKGYLPDNGLGITADSIVVKDGVIFEKPKDKQDAIRILSELSNNDHIVYTGVTIFTKDKKVSFTEETKVTLAVLSQSEIEYYIDNYHPFDKAGSYGIQDWIGLCKVSNIQGSYTNVMGLPMHRLYEELANF